MSMSSKRKIDKKPSTACRVRVKYPTRNRSRIAGILKFLVNQSVLRILVHTSHIILKTKIQLYQQYTNLNYACCQYKGSNSLNVGFTLIQRRIQR